jgi:DNA-binding transcriptional ArsR family regulator
MPRTAAAADVFHAIADPTRRGLLDGLLGGETSVGQLAAAFDVSLPAISQHLKVLERAGLIVRGRDGQKRPCQLCPDRLAEARQWLDHTRRAWEARFDRLERFLDDTSTPSKDDRDEQ